MSEQTDHEAGGKSGDADVSPMAAQNTGPAKKGATDEPLRQDGPGEPSGDRNIPDTPMKPGGEGSTRDDI